MSPRTRPFLTTHRKVISCIHIMFRQQRFAIHELHKQTNVSVSSITRTLRKLVELKLVRHHPNSGLDRNYEVSYLWNQDVMKVIEVFEMAKILNL